MKQVFVGLGGNVGSVKESFKNALLQLKKLPTIKNIAVSGLYLTSPVSDIVQPDYLNCVVGFECEMPVRELFNYLQAIEKSLGTKLKVKNAPRTIDIDLLLYGNDEVHEPDLEVPHPRYEERLFVLVPMLELTKAIGALEIERQINMLRKQKADQVKLIEDRRWCA